MRKTLILFFFAFLTVNVSAQPEIEYTYDDAGNRIQRNVLIVGGMIQNNEDGTAQQSLEEQLHIEDEGDILFNL